MLILLCWSLDRTVGMSHKLAVAATFVCAAAAMTNVQALEPMWPTSLDDANITPLDGLYSTVTALYMVARVPQIMQNFRLGHTGVLSFISVGMQFGGSAARIATSVHNGLAPVVVWSFAISAALNGILLAQVLFYWGATKKAMQKKDNKKLD